MRAIWHGCNGEGIENQIKSGYAGGSWTGNGITSASAATAASATHKTALGIIEASDEPSVYPGTFKGQNVDSTAVLIRYTASGDANLDGTVDLTDFTLLASKFNWAYSGDAAGAIAAGLGAAVPEPGTIAVMLTALVLGARRRSR